MVRKYTIKIKYATNKTILNVIDHVIATVALHLYAHELRYWALLQLR